MNWDDVRYALAVATAGSLAGAAKALEVDHTTVGRRVDALESALGVRLFTRTPAGYVPTGDAERLLGPMRSLEEAAHALARHATARQVLLDGKIRVTSPESFGVSYLAPLLAAYGVSHPKIEIELKPSGKVLDLGRREAEVAIRFFKSSHRDLVVRRVGAIAFGLYASTAYLEKHPFRAGEDIGAHAILSVPEPDAIESEWLAKLGKRPRVSFASTLSLALVAAARASAGIALLPRYLGDTEPSLRRLAVPGEPTTAIWLTVHRDLRKTPRVRALLDYIVARLEEDAKMLGGLS